LPRCPRDPATIAAVILAAGASSRMGTPKALLDAGGGESFLDHLAGTFLDAGCAVYVVLGEQAEAIEQASHRSGTVTFVRNPNPSRGQLSSLQCGLRAVEPDVEAIFFTPVDAPGISLETILVLKDLLAGMDFAIPIYEGKRGHPVLMRAACAAQFLAPPEAASARDILHSRRAATRFVEVADPAILDDIDDPETYGAWRSGVLSGRKTASNGPVGR
jgi:CTP:molybdopterin cytidylyltransferase MocA